MSPAEQIQNELNEVEKYLVGRIEVDFPTFDDVRLGKFDGDDQSFQGIFTIAHSDEKRIAYVFNTTKSGPLLVGRA